MSKTIKYLSLMSALIWVFCFFIAIFHDANYRIAFIIASATLAIWFAFEFWEAIHFDRKTKGSDDKS